jgi:hypothetical protein
MSNGVIDLGEAREAPAAAVADRPPFPFRIVFGALSIVLIALLAGGVPRARQAPPTVIPARLGDATFVSDDRLFVVSAGRQVRGTDVQNRVVTTYSLPDARLLGTTTVSVSGGVTWAWQGGGVVVVSYQVNTTGVWAVVAVAENTGKALWRRAARWVGGSVQDGLAVLSTDDAEMAVELTTGRVRWSLPHPRDGYTAAAGPDVDFPRWLVTVTDSGRLESRDPRTGGILAHVGMVKMPGRANGLMWSVGDLIVVAGGGSGFDAYRLPGLAKVWHSTADLSQSWTQADCGRLLCTFRMQRGMTVLDAADGRELWSDDRWAYAEASGKYLLAAELDRSSDRPVVYVLDPASGRPLGTFGDWEFLGPAPGGKFYGKLDVRGKYKIFYGLLDPATRHVRILGSGSRVSGSCETGRGVLMCRLMDASIALWPLG